MTLGVIGFIVMGIGAAGVVSSTILEIKKKEPIYALLMKIFPLIFAIGCGLWAIG